ncbi:hypothetical protein KQX54_020908 [Cotesia glomerata]|uniref:Uncharacterized protein n=1 Tax=Cotesia glomerata TaxID=32391 RepID=A0AAV7I736_COTGL|nr:hypothetical protein KQX54_020908 [Cotesia glomerata]
MLEDWPKPFVCSIRNRCWLSECMCVVSHLGQLRRSWSGWYWGSHTKRYGREPSGWRMVVRSLSVRSTAERVQAHKRSGTIAAVETRHEDIH